MPRCILTQNATGEILALWKSKLSQWLQFVAGEFHLTALQRTEQHDLTEPPRSWMHKAIWTWKNCCKAAILCWLSSYAYKTLLGRWMPRNTFALKPSRLVTTLKVFEMRRVSLLPSTCQHLRAPLTLLEKPKLRRCRFNWHWLLLQAPKSAGLPQLTCSTASQPLQRLQGWAQRQAGCAARRRHRAACRGSCWRTSRHIQGMEPPRANKHKVCWDTESTATTCRQPSTSRAIPHLWACRPVVSELAARKLKNILNICSAE